MLANLTSAALAAALLAGTALTGSADAQVSVKLGVLNDMSGPYADISGPGAVVAAQMAVEDFGAGKGVRAEIVSADHQNKPDNGSAIARRWYDQDGVDAIFDVTNSGVALAVSEVTREKNKVFMISGGGSSDLTGTKCTPNNVHWTYDTWALANGTGSAVTRRGGKSWYFLTADYAFGAALERDTSDAVRQAGGQVLGSVKHPLSASDFSSFLLQAQASKAQVIGLADAGSDTTTAIKQAAEFGIVQGGQSLAGLLVLTEAFYWDQNEATRAFSKRFAARFGDRMPTSSQAGVYSSVLHYLKAVSTLKGKATADVMARMREMPIDDPLFGQGTVRADGRATHPMYLYEVKKPSESKGEWDMYKTIATIPTKEAFRPMETGGCSLVGKS